MDLGTQRRAQWWVSWVFWFCFLYPRLGDENSEPPKFRGVEGGHVGSLGFHPPPAVRRPPPLPGKVESQGFQHCLAVMRPSPHPVSVQATWGAVGSTLPSQRGISGGFLESWNSHLHVGENIQGLGIGKEFLDLTPKPWSIKASIDKWDFIKIFKIYPAEDPIKRMKRQTTDWDKYLQTIYSTKD